MFAFMLTIGLFLIFSLIGHTVVTLCLLRMRVLQKILVSPALGISCVLLPVFMINRVGIPVKDFGLSLFIIWLIAAVLIHFWRRPIFPIKYIWPLGLILFAALLLAGWPMLFYGFNWVSYGNDDMTNYALAAARFYHSGFYDIPNISALQLGENYPQAYWFMHVVDRARSGSELLLAWVWSITGVNAHKIFMPTIVALHLCLICATLAVTLIKACTRRNLLILAVLCAAAPLMTLGVVFQLVAQVGGLALLCAGMVFVLRPYHFHIRKIAQFIPAALILSVLIIYYPELIPFGGVIWCAFVALKMFNSRQNVLFNYFLPIGIVICIIVATVPQAIADAFHFLVMVIGFGAGFAKRYNLFLFPYYLIPSGLPAFWGIIPFARPPNEPWLNISIFLSLILSATIACSAWQQLRRHSAAALLFLIMTMIAVLFLIKKNDFGLFKLAMFAQPFFLSVLAIQIANNKNKIALSCFGLLFVAMLFTQWQYTALSTGEFGSSNEIKNASSARLYDQLEEFFTKQKTYDAAGLLLDTTNIVLAKLIPLYTQDQHLLFTQRYFTNIVETTSLPPNGIISGGMIWPNKYQTFHFQKPISSDEKSIMFAIPRYLTDKNMNKWRYLTTNTSSTIFNHYHASSSEQYFTDAKPVNTLSYIESNLGKNYFAPQHDLASFFQLEKDPFFKDGYFASLGQHFLFLVLGSTPKPRIYMSLSSTVMAHFDAELPHPRIHGSQSYDIGFVGRGSGRVISQPLNLVQIDHLDYLAIDMGRKTQQFPIRRVGLMNLFGIDVPLDYRWLTTFGRDISLISEEEYQNFTPPSELKKFPDDLGNKQLEYSGIYEDGWISEKSFFILSTKGDAQKFTLKGMVPGMGDPNFKTTVTIKLDDKVRDSKELGLGEFTIEVPLTKAEKNQNRLRVDLEFSAFQRLHGRNPFAPQDGRATPAHITYLGFSHAPIP